MAASAKKEVLCVFGQRRRPMSFSVGVGEADYDCVLREAKKVFEDIIPSSSILILQVKNEEWSGEFTDLKEADTIPDRSIVRLVAEVPQVLYVFSTGHAHGCSN